MVWDGIGREFSLDLTLFAVYSCLRYGATPAPRGRWGDEGAFTNEREGAFRGREQGRRTTHLRPRRTEAEPTAGFRMDNPIDEWSPESDGLVRTHP